MKHAILAKLHSIQLDIIIQLIMGIDNVIFSVNSGSESVTILYFKSSNSKMTMLHLKD